MATWSASNVTLTTLGETVLSQVESGNGALTLTKIVASSQQVDASTLQAVTTVSPQNQLMTISKKYLYNSGSAIDVMITNEEVTTEYTLSTIGIFASHPDYGEFLYLIAQCTGMGDLVPLPSVTPVTLSYTFYLMNSRDSQFHITVSNAGLVRTGDFNAHVDSATPHPNAPSLKTDVTMTDKFWVQSSSDKHLHGMSLDNARTLILGDNASTIPVLRSRVNQLEIEQANIALKLVAENDCPDSNMLLAEDFATPDKIDTFAVQVLSIVAGDNGIDVQTLTGIIPGAWYWVTDGVNQEYVQVKSCIKNGSVYRILINSNITNTYTVPDTLIYRTTAEIGSSVAYGSGDKKGFNWSPGTTWAGVSANVASVVKVDTSQSNADSFTKTGDVAFTTDGLFTLATN